MGFCLSWIAIKDLPSNEIFERIGVRRTGEFSDAPDDNLCYLSRKNGWHMIISNSDDLLNQKPRWLRKLSVDRDVYFGFVEEHVMYSSACCFNNGKRVWHIEHDSSRGIDHLKTSGKLPECFERVYKENLKKSKANRESQLQEAEAERLDYIFDVPVEITEILTGYQYDIVGEDEVYWSLAVENSDPHEEMRLLLSPILCPKGFSYYKKTRQFLRQSSKWRDEITVQVLSGNRVAFYFGVLHREVAETIAKLKGQTEANEYSGTMRHYSPNVGPEPHNCLEFRLDTIDWFIESERADVFGAADNSELYSDIVEFINELALPYIDRYQDLAAIREDLSKNDRLSLTRAYEQVLAIDLLWSDREHVLSYRAAMKQEWKGMAGSWDNEFVSFYNAARAIKPDVFPELDEI